jgi:hypothetical protein
LLARFQESRENNGKFYDKKTIMGLDMFGFPAAALANSILVEFDNFGDSTRQLEKSWSEWLHFYPFDTKVTEKLVELYQKRIDTLNPQKDAAQVRLIGKKLQLLKNHLERYRSMTSIKPKESPADANAS